MLDIPIQKLQQYSIMQMIRAEHRERGLDNDLPIVKRKEMQQESSVTQNASP
jgi:hypothetical protein